MAPKILIFYGTFISLPQTTTQDKSAKHAFLIRRGALTVSPATGRILSSDWTVDSESALQSFIAANNWSPSEVQLTIARESHNEFFFPGFIDTHIHAPQYPNSGLFGSSTLLNWLETYTFPLESSMGDLDKAHTVYSKVIDRTLANGTTFASYFATTHVAATNLLATLAFTKGQRALIGRVCMDNSSFCPEYYKDESAEDSLHKTQETITHIQTLDPAGQLVKPIITPRFAPTCTPTSLSNLGTLAKSYTPPLHIQTHISENIDEVALVQDLFPESSSYADVYDQHNLLTEKTILAHAVHLTPAEKTLIAERKSKIAHCPASNSALGSGLAPVRDLLDHGITVGLGTDVSGGYSCGVLEAVRGGCLVSRLLRHSKSAVASQGASDGKKEEEEGREVLSVEESLYLATRGGAAVVGMEEELGGFEEGMFWDVQMVRLGGDVSASVGSKSQTPAESGKSTVDIFGWESWTEKVHKWVWTGDDRNVSKVWVRGRLVHELQESAGSGTWSETVLGGVSRKGWVGYVLAGVGVATLGAFLGRRGRAF
ncbi:hypothetical protein BJY04DRAFT_202074 [Aspergillus karnatakaensis]|uniref:chlorohydrolase family protein n=1 Tax=Aspergillus karnatakaensis TaxID=1810916 RepID=UPI003CCE1869